jgi:hypothetical protein
MEEGDPPDLAWTTSFGQQLITGVRFDIDPLFEGWLAIWQELVDADRRWSKLRAAWTGAVGAAQIARTIPTRQFRTAHILLLKDADDAKS